MLGGCAGTKGEMIKEMDSPAKVALLKERAQEYWDAAVKEDYEKTYFLFDPFFRAVSDKYKFLGTRGVVKYRSFEIKGVKVEGNVGLVKVSVIYFVDTLKYKKQKFSQPDTPVEFEETWVFVGDNWYKEYKMDETSGTFDY